MSVDGLDSRQKVMDVFNRKSTGKGVMWTGSPFDETVSIYAKEWGIEFSHEAVFQYLNDDCRWGGTWEMKVKPGANLIDPNYGMKNDKKKGLAEGGCFSEVETVAEIEAYPWPSIDDVEFNLVAENVERLKDKMVFTGLWSSFYHDMCGFFGMEKYFIQMYENPAVVEAATEKIVDFYVAANDKLFSTIGENFDTLFMGNDFGTQLDLMVSPDKFREFVLPSIKRIADVGKKHGKKVMLHSCGSIYRIIPDLIDIGVDVIHPIQAKAVGMDAESLAQYKNDVAFVGGIDAQGILPFGTPEQVADEVKRVREILGPNIVISASHEAILPNIPAANMVALAKAAHE